MYILRMSLTWLYIVNLRMKFYVVLALGLNLELDLIGNFWDSYVLMFCTTFIHNRLIDLAWFLLVDLYNFLWVLCACRCIQVVMLLLFWKLESMLCWLVGKEYLKCNWVYEWKLGSSFIKKIINYNVVSFSDVFSET